MIDFLCLETSTNRYRHSLALSNGNSSRFNIDRSLLYHTRERTLCILGCISSHILTKPRHSRTILAIPDDSRITVSSPCLAIDIAPESYTSHIVSLPHVRNLFLVTLKLKFIIRCTNVILRAIHRNLQGILNLIHSILEISLTHICKVVRLTSVSINRSTCIAESPNKINELSSLPLEGVIVIINKDSIWPTLMSHLECLDNPVIASLAVTTKSSLVRCRLMTSNSLVHHVNHRKLWIVFLYSIKIFLDCLILLFG